MDKQKGSKLMFYVSAIIAILGVVAYQYFIKRVPASLNPVVSVVGIYISVLVMSAILLPAIPVEGGLLKQFRQLNWIQPAIAVSVMMVEIGYLLMYRYGWNLSTGNLVTGVVINIILVGLGLILFGEKINPLNILGIALSIVGVTLIGYRPAL